MREPVTRLSTAEVALRGMEITRTWLDEIVPSEWHVGETVDIWNDTSYQLGLWDVPMQVTAVSADTRTVTISRSVGGSYALFNNTWLGQPRVELRDSNGNVLRQRVTNRGTSFGPGMGDV